MGTIKDFYTAFLNLFLHLFFPEKSNRLSLALFTPLHVYRPWNSPGHNTGVGSLSILQGIFPTQGWNPGLPHFRQILYQLSHKRSPRILEWVAYLFSSGSSQLRNQLGSPALQVDSLPAELSGKPVFQTPIHK